MAIGYACLLVLSRSGALLATGLFAMSTASLMGSWFHDGIHIEKSKRPWFIRAIIRVASAPLGISPLWWGYKHVLLHHRYVGQADKDPDIQLGWMLRVTPDQPWKPTHRFQWIYMWVIYPFGALNMLKPGEIYQARYLYKKTGHKFRTPMWRCLLDKYVPFAIVWAPVAIIKGTQAIPAFLVYQVVAGSLTAIITQVQHDTLLTASNYRIEEEDNLSRQVFMSSDVESRRMIWWWICGGVNYHAIHHLIPSLTIIETPAATRRLRSVLRPMGFDVPTHRNVVTAFVSHVRLIYRLSKPAVEKAGL
jgi:linoleoyl-CoA desaturase